MADGPRLVASCARKCRTFRVKPSEYFAEHFWLTTQPMEEPPLQEQFVQLLEQALDMDDRLMFATDYPHWDFDSPDPAVPASLRPESAAQDYGGERPRALWSGTARLMATYVVATVDEIPPGSRKIVSVGGRSIGVFNVNGEYFALLNRCPHQAGPLVRGQAARAAGSGRPGEYRYSRPGEILRCPWHGWEFDVRPGNPGSILRGARAALRSGRPAG